MSLGYFEGQNVLTQAFKVAAASTGIQRGTFVALQNDGTVDTAAAAGAAIGVAVEDYQTSGSAPYVYPSRTGVAVRLMGTALVEAGAAVTPGSELEVGSGGKAVPKSTGTVVGVALTGAAAAGDMIVVLLK